MIKELSDLGKTLRGQKADNAWVHDALKEETISIDLIIAKDGSFQKFDIYDKKTTIAEAITAKKGKARLLLDKAEEVLGYGGAASNKKHELYLEKIKQYGDMEELSPVIAFYQNNKQKGIDKALIYFELAIPDEKNRKGNIGFRILTEGSRIHESPVILQTIIARYEASQKKITASNTRLCSICGTSKYPVEDIPHGMIKKVPDGQSSGSALISYNVDAFESYGLKGNNNSSVCTNCAKTYVEGLNWLLSSGNEIKTKTRNGKEKPTFRYTNRKNFGSDTAMVFWTRKNATLSEIEQLEEPNPADVAKLIDAVSSGKDTDAKYLESDRFYSFCLSGAAARIAVRDWIELSLSDVRSSIAKWFWDIAITEYKRDTMTIQTQYPRLYDLARTCQRKNTGGTADKADPALARVATHLWNAALKNTAPPLWILTRVLQRARLDESGINSDKAALIKLILNRNNKGGGFVITEIIQEGKRPVAYVCGQIFAKLENIQYAALGEVSAGIRERYFTYAMTMPGAAFGRLFNLNSKHFTKIRSEKPGLAVNLDKELQSLCKDIEINNFPATFALEEQGQFAIGYYHQKQAQFSNQKLKEKIEER